MRRTAICVMVGALVLAACEETATTGTAVDSGLPSPAQAACMSAVARETGDGNVTVLGSSRALTGTELLIGVGDDRAQWRCLASNDGVVEEVSSVVDESAV